MPYNLRKRKNPVDPEPDEEEEDETIIYNPEYFKQSDGEFIERIVKNKASCRYKALMKEARKTQISGYVKLTDILDADISDEKKAELVVVFDRIKYIPYYDPEFITTNEYIKNALKENTSTFASGESDILEKIKTASICEENRTKLIAKFFSLQKCDSTERHELMAYIDYGLKIKNTSYKSPESLKYSDETAHVFAKSIKDSLDEHIYGQTVAKEEIIDNVIARENNPDIGNITVFKGSPGVGKTHTARKLAELLGYKFYHISIGGITTAERITGSLSVNIGSRPGEIFTAISEMGCNNGIIFLDEFDKIFSGDGHGMESLRNVFLNMLDPTQNCHFRDNYLYDLNIDLSKIWFIISVNELGFIGEAVRDRLRPVIHFENYSKADRLEILRQHIIPRTLKMYRINVPFISFTTESYNYLISQSAGIRELKCMCETIFKKVSTLLLTAGSDYKPSYYVEIPIEDGVRILDLKIVKTLLPKNSEEKFMSFYS